MSRSARDTSPRAAILAIVAAMPARRLSITLASALAVSCNGEPQGDTGSAGSTSTGAPSTSTSEDPTTGADPTTTTGDPTTDPPITTSSTTGTTDDPVTTSTTGDPGLACPLDDVPGVESLQLAPPLFADGADPSGDPVCAIVNPERGFFQFNDLRGLELWAVENAVTAGYSLLYGRVLLSEYRDAPLDPGVLADVAAGLDLARDHGLKVIPRFHYSDDGDEPDAPLDVILGHIDQLTPLLNDHADVIFTLQAGFIGAWGEWHSSQNGLDAPGPRKQILDALLAALPATRTVSVRRPSFKSDAYAGPLSLETAHDGSALARVGHINDCFLASDSDFGTYQEPGEKDYAIADSAFVPVGGETCAVNPPRSECPAALAELELHHWTHINAGYHPDVLQGWQDDGCYAEIACRLGYRLVVRDLKWAATATAGGTIPVSLELFNDGWAAPTNARPLALVFDGPTRVEVATDFDVRTALAGESHTVCVDAALPADLPPGTYRIGVRLADPAPALADDPRYAIRLADADAVEWSDGINWFAAEFTAR